MTHKRTVNGSFSRHETSWGSMKDVASQFHVYIRDYQGKILTGMPHGDATGASANRHKFGGKEYLTESGLNELDFGARHMLPQYGTFTSPDPKAADCRHLSPWAYCAGDPVNNIDPTGMSVIYTVNGDYIGHSSEGFNGEVLIYTGTANIDFSKLTHEEIMNKYSFDIFPFDSMVTNNEFTPEARSKIWTHIVSQFEGNLVFDQLFLMNRISGEKIYFDNIGDANWVTLYCPSDPNTLPIIKGNGFHAYTTIPYESTVENIASSVLVHEWYSHGIKQYDDPYTHRYAYENVINYKTFWNRTTMNYKVFVLRQLQNYTKNETGMPFIGPNYILLYNLYVK